MTFTLDPRLEADSIFLGCACGCQIRMMDDARYPWLMLIPEVANAIELFDLPEPHAAEISALARRLGAMMKAAFGADKINIGVLGNVVSQLHIHVVARQISDAAWPGPVWGFGAREHIPTTLWDSRMAAFQTILSALQK